MGKSDKKRKRSEEPHVEQDIIAQKLAAYGESFMDLFEPTETDRRRSNAENDAQEHDPQMDESHSDSGSTSDDDSSSGDSGSDTDPGARRRGSEDGTMEFIFSKNMVSTKQNDSHKVQKTVAGPSAAPGIDDLAMLERRRFMSHRADVVSGTAAHLNAPGKKHKPGNSKADEGTEGLSREDFLKLQREVQLYGASALDKKSRAQFNAAMLQSLGAKKEKGMRIPASIGIGMAKKKAEREARALEEAIAAGMVKRKGMGNKKKREQKANIDRGLAEDGGAFRNGVLKVAPGAQSLGVRNRGSGGGKWRGGGGGGKRGRR